MWNRLSQSEKNKLLLAGIKNNIPYIEDVIDAYNEYAMGGKVDWIEDQNILKPELEDYITVNNYALGGDEDINETQTNDITKLLKNNTEKPTITYRYGNTDYGFIPEGTVPLNEEAQDIWLPNITVVGKRPKKLNFIKSLYNRIIGTANYGKDNYPTLESAIRQAYKDGNAGDNIIWDNRLYKAVLSDRGLEKFIEDSDPRRKSNLGYGVDRNFYLNNIKSSIDYNEDFKAPKLDIAQLNSMKKQIAEKQQVSGSGSMYDIYNNPLKFMYDAFRNLQIRNLTAMNQFEYNYPTEELESDNTLLMSDLDNAELKSILIPKHIIQDVVNNLDNKEDAYKVLAIAMQEYRYGQGKLSDNKLPDNQGYTRKVFNNHAYELDNSIYNSLGALCRKAYKKVYGEDADETEIKRRIASVNKYAALANGDITEETDEKEVQFAKILHTLAQEQIPYHLQEYLSEFDKNPENFYVHTAKTFNKGTYNPGMNGYNNKVLRFRDKMKKSSILTNYVEKLYNEKNSEEAIKKKEEQEKENKRAAKQIELNQAVIREAHNKALNKKALGGNLYGGDTPNTSQMNMGKYAAHNPYLRSIGIGQRPVTDFSMYGTKDWYDAVNGEYMDVDKMDNNTMAWVHPYTGEIIPMHRFFQEDETKAQSYASTDDFYIKPYQGYRFELLPYHDTKRMYKVPVKTGEPDDNPNSPIYPFDSNEYFQLPQLIGEDNWEDPSENALNYMMAGELGLAKGLGIGATAILNREVASSISMGELFKHYYEDLSGREMTTAQEIFNPGYLLSYSGLKNGLINLNKALKLEYLYKKGNNLIRQFNRTRKYYPSFKFYNEYIEKSEDIINDYIYKYGDIIGGTPKDRARGLKEALELKDREIKKIYLEDKQFADFISAGNMSEYFNEAPEYAYFCFKEGLDPSLKTTANAFIKRQETSIRGVHSLSAEEADKAAVTGYKTRLNKKIKGGDQITSKGGVYTSNSGSLSSNNTTVLNRDGKMVEKVGNRFVTPVNTGGEGDLFLLHTDFMVDPNAEPLEQIRQFKNRSIDYDVVNADRIEKVAEPTQSRIVLKRKSPFDMSDYTRHYKVGEYRYVPERKTGYRIKMADPNILAIQHPYFDPTIYERVLVTTKPEAKLANILDKKHFIKDSPRTDRWYGAIMDYNDGLFLPYAPSNDFRTLLHYSRIREAGTAKMHNDITRAAETTMINRANLALKLEKQKAAFAEKLRKATSIVKSIGGIGASGGSVMSAGYALNKYGEYKRKKDWDEMSDEEFFDYYDRFAEHYSTIDKYAEERRCKKK